MKFQKIFFISLTIVIPAMFLALMSQSLVEAAERQQPQGIDALGVDALDEANVGERAGGSAQAPLVDEADLAIEKSGAPGAVAAGNQLTYTLEISNSGTLSATNVVVTDTLPANVTIDHVSTSRGGDCLEAAEVLCPLGDFLVDDSVTITIVLTVDPDASGVLHNVARVRSSTVESNTVNNRDTLDTPVFAEADLSISKTDSDDPVDAGSNFSYTLSVANLGPSDATGVVLTDTLPSSTTLVSASSSQGPACAEGSRVICELGVIPAGDEATVFIEVATDQTFAGLLVNEAEVRSLAADPDGLNNTAGEETSVVPIVDLSLSKSSTPETAVAGESLAYHLIVTNSGQFSATNVVLTDVLPANTSIITVSASLGACNQGGTVTCSLGTLQPGDWATVDIDLLVDPTATNDLVNQAETSTEVKESNYENNSVVLTTTLEVLADLSVGKTADPDPAVAGGLLTYSIVVNNAGPSDATGVQISDTLPVSTTFISASIVQGATIVHTIDTSLWEPSSPDPAGLAYVPVGDRLMVSDSEVDEHPFDRDENLFAATRQGDFITVTTTTQFSEEPNGLAYDPDSETLFVSDDVQDRVFMLLAGPDGNFGTADDVISDFPTSVFSNTVPEGLAFDNHRGHLYTIDGSLNDVFDIGPGDDEALGTADDVITRFDVRVFGIVDGEGIAYNPESGTIWVGDHGGPRVIETTVDGSFLRTFELTPDSIRVAGLTVAPSTANPSVLSLYIADRGVDNNQDPTENDGKIYEVAIPTSTSQGGFCDGEAVVECNLGTVAAGDTALVSIVVQAHPLASGVLTNSVAVQSTALDVNSGNNASTITTTVINRADLILTKIGEPDPVVAGEQLTYTLVISNRGPSHAEGVLLEDLLPANTAVYTTVASQGAGCSGDPSVLCDLGQIMAGSQATVTIVVDVGANALFSLTNQATVSSLTADDFPQDNAATEVTTVTPQAELALDKVAWPVTVTAGTRLTYTLVVTNNGPSDAQDVVLTDTLPGGASLISASASQGPGCSGGSAPACNLGILTPDSTASVTIVVTVTPGVTGTLLNVADVASPTADPNSGNNHAQTLTAVETVADISVAKAAQDEPVNAGDVLTYTVTISNAGPSDAVSVVLTDTLPGGASFIAAAANQPLDCSVAGKVVCQLGTLAANTSVVVTLTTGISPSLTAQQITNTVQVASSTGDPDATNNHDQVKSTVKTLADLSVAKTASADQILAGTVLTYVVTVQNLGPSDATGVLVTDTLPAEAALLSFSSSQGSCSGATEVACSLGDMGPASSVAITIVVSIDSGASGAIENLAVVQGEQDDPDLGNNEAHLLTNVNLEGSLPLSMTDDPDPVFAGTQLTYTLWLTSVGPSNASNVVLTDTLPGGVQFVTVTYDTGSCEHNSGLITCLFGDMPPASSASVEVLVLVDTDTLGQINNQAIVTADEAEPSLVNQNTTVIASADLRVTNTAAPSEVAPGGVITYTINVTNGGPSLARNVVVNNSLPGGVSFKSSPSCAQDNGTITCALGNLDANEAAQVYFLVDVDAGASGPAPSTASGLSDTPDPRPGNNSDTAVSFIVVGSDLAIAKRVTPAQPAAGATITYTLAVTNYGPSTATGVQVIDTLPDGVVKLSATTSKGTSCPGTTVLLCSLGALSNGHTVAITIVVQIDDPFHGDLTNTAEVLSAVNDPDESNNTAVLTVNIPGFEFPVYLPVLMKP